MAFILVKENTDVVYKKLRIASQAYTLGDLAQIDITTDNIDVIPATAATVTSRVYAVAMETVPSTATEALFCLVDPAQEWKVDTVNNTATTDNFQKMILTDVRTINNTHTNATTPTAVFLQTGISGAAADKKAIGNILRVPNVTA